MATTNRKLISIAAFCEEFEVAKRTFYEWRAKGVAPRCIKLPNGELRIRQIDLDRWLDTREEAA